MATGEKKLNEYNAEGYSVERSLRVLIICCCGAILIRKFEICDNICVRGFFGFHVLGRGGGQSGFMNWLIR